MGGTSQGASSVILSESLVLHLPGDKALGLGPYQWLQATKCGWVKATGAAAICPLWLQPVVSGLCHRQATPEDLCETQHKSHACCLDVRGHISLQGPAVGGKELVFRSWSHCWYLLAHLGALRRTQNGVLGRGEGASLGSSRGSSGTTLGGWNCVN